MRHESFLFPLLLITILFLVFTEAVNGPPNWDKPSGSFSPYFYCNETTIRGTIECELDGQLKIYENKEDEVMSVTDIDWWIDLMVSTFLVCTSGMMSGLTIGLMGLDITNLEIVKKTGTPEEKRHAKRILPLLKRHHLLLCTLLLCNAAALEALPIFLEHLMPPVMAVVISVTLILLFGEVIPQSLCTRWGLAIGANLSYLVWFLIIISFPIAWPISKILDFAIGKDHGTFFNRAELKELITIHGERLKKADEKDLPADVLTYDEVTIIRGALDLKKKTVNDCLTSLEKTFMLNINDIMDIQKLNLISENGHSRIPVYRVTPSHIVGMILTKDLLLLGPHTQTPISSLEIRRMPMVCSSTPLYKMLDIFRGGNHMAVVISPKDYMTPQGIITLEDVIEELIQEDIEDEADMRRKERLHNEDEATLLDGATQVKSPDDFSQTDIHSVYWAQDEEDVEKSENKKGKRKKFFFSKFV